MVLLFDGNISDIEEDPNEEKELDLDCVPDENVHSCPLEIEIERCDPTHGAATTSFTDQMKGLAVTNDQLENPVVVVLSTGCFKCSSSGFPKLFETRTSICKYFVSRTSILCRINFPE